MKRKYILTALFTAVQATLSARSTTWEDENFWSNAKRKCDLRISSDRPKCPTASQCSERLTAPCQEDNQLCVGECIPRMPSTCTIYHDAICPPGFRCAIPLDGDRAGSCLANGEKAPYPEKREPSTMIPPPSTWTGAPRYLPVPTSHSDGDYPSCIRPTYPCVATPTGSGVSGSGTGLPNPGGKKQPCGSRGHQPCPSGYRCAMYAINQFVADTGGQCVRVGEKPAFAELQTGPLGRPGGGLAAAKGSGEQNED